uniref:Uncharacterized protein n=1 Tax=Arundo donax TaxID=35708 RepID=A0A0A9G3K2_ARUDO
MPAHIWSLRCRVGGIHLCGQIQYKCFVWFVRAR